VTTPRSGVRRTSVDQNSLTLTSILFDVVAL
jgi:hypothetical protein